MSNEMNCTKSSHSASSRDKWLSFIANTVAPFVFFVTSIKGVNSCIKNCNTAVETVSRMLLPGIIKKIIYGIILLVPFFTLAFIMLSAFIKVFKPIYKATNGDDYLNCLRKYPTWVTMETVFTNKKVQEKIKKIFMAAKNFAYKVYGFIYKMTMTIKRGIIAVLMFAKTSACNGLDRVSNMVDHTKQVLQGQQMYLLHMTEIQFQVLLRVIETTQDLYSGKLRTIMDDIKRQYNTTANIDVVLSKIQFLYSSKPINNKWIPIHRLMGTITNCSIYKQSSHPWTIKVTENERRLLGEIFEVYMRISMGQFHIILEELNPHYEPGSLFDNQFYEAYMDGSPDLLEVRSMMIPSLKGVPWRGGHGICSTNVSKEAKLAYQIHSVLIGEKPLPVTEEPLPFITTVS